MPLLACDDFLIYLYIFPEDVQLHCTTLYGVPFPCPAPQVRWAQTLWKVPEAEFESCTRQPSRYRYNHGKPIQEGVLWMARRPSLSSSIFRTVVTSQPWIRLTGGYARPGGYARTIVCELVCCIYISILQHVFSGVRKYVPWL